MGTGSHRIVLVGVGGSFELGISHVRNVGLYALEREEIRGHSIQQR